VPSDGGGSDISKADIEGLCEAVERGNEILIASAQAARSDLKAQTKELTGAHKDAAREMGNVVSAPQMPGGARDDCIARARQDQCIASGPPDRAGWISRMRSSKSTRRSIAAQSEKTSDESGETHEAELQREDEA
jgi:hypothetical protein